MSPLELADLSRSDHRPLMANFRPMRTFRDPPSPIEVEFPTDARLLDRLGAFQPGSGKSLVILHQPAVIFTAVTFLLKGTEHVEDSRSKRQRRVHVLRGA